MTLYYGIDEKYAPKFFSFLILGILQSIDRKHISIAEAEGYIFQPNIPDLLKEINAPEELIEIAELGCELDDVADIAPSSLQALMS
ncbi:hypothetical protein Xvie_02012 [Xenorhabdus vietnamensis]|uniref:Uncharacterized protein n=1 Tax=Xenorhabdus vietnamensis TaxID=351656 RepID=A0A1Y2SEK1_9GAMM|nr:DUF3969 family protein [Xenorhabdus vietnamensis]OTA16242.1 hypothetical protein Xvie_02012 [Xenorhabdus vietnamensis]